MRGLAAQNAGGENDKKSSQQDDEAQAPCRFATLPSLSAMDPSPSPDPARFYPASVLCYIGLVLHRPSIAGLQNHEVTAISRQCELLILCARIGFNP